MANNNNSVHCFSSNVHFAYLRRGTQRCCWSLPCQLTSYHRPCHLRWPQLTCWTNRDETAQRLSQVYPHRPFRTCISGTHDVLEQYITYSAGWTSPTSISSNASLTLRPCSVKLNIQFGKSAFMTALADECSKASYRGPISAFLKRACCSKSSTRKFILWPAGGALSSFHDIFLPKPAAPITKRAI